MLDIQLGTLIQHYLFPFLSEYFVLLIAAYLIFRFILSLKSVNFSESNEFFTPEESKVKCYYKKYFSDSETPFYLVEALWYELLAYINDYYGAFGPTSEWALSEDYFINNPYAEFDFSSHKLFGQTFWKNIRVKFNLGSSILEEYKGCYTFKELVEYIGKKLKPSPRILVVSNNNTSYSFFVEALINYLGKDRFKAFSVKNSSIDHIDHNILAVLERNGIPIADYKSQSLTDYRDQWFDIVISVGDSSTKETCTSSANGLAHTHWNVADFGQVTTTENNFEEATQATYIALAERTKQLLNIPIEALESDEINLALNRISEGF